MRSLIISYYWGFATGVNGKQPSLLCLSVEKKCIKILFFFVVVVAEKKANNHKNTQQELYPLLFK
jgi:hypothetical protein